MEKNDIGFEIQKRYKENSGRPEQYVRYRNTIMY